VVGYMRDGGVMTPYRNLVKAIKVRKPEIQLDTYRRLSIL